MARNQISFFATRADLDSLFRAVESKRSLQAVVAGLYDSPKIQPMHSLLDVPNLGVTSSGDPNHGPIYLIADRETGIEVREVPQRRGGLKYAIDQQVNPTTITFRPAGRFGDRCVIAGQLGTISADARSLELLNFFRRELRQKFTKIQSDYVGETAENLLDRGWRLTGNVKSPAIYDLKRD